MWGVKINSHSWDLHMKVWYLSVILYPCCEIQFQTLSLHSLMRLGVWGIHQWHEVSIPRLQVEPPSNSLHLLCQRQLCFVKVELWWILESESHLTHGGILMDRWLCFLVKYIGNLVGAMLSLVILNLYTDLFFSISNKTPRCIAFQVQMHCLVFMIYH